MSFQKIDDLAEKLRPSLLQLRIIIGAMAAAVLVFLCLAIALYLESDRGPMDEMASLIQWIAIGAAPLAFLASRVLAAAYATNARRKLVAGTLPTPVYQNDAGQIQPLPLAELGDAGKMFSVYMTKTILAGAVREGAAFFCTVAFLITGSPIALAAALALVATLLVLWPSPAGVAEWINEQLRLADAEKLLDR